MRDDEMSYQEVAEESKTYNLHQCAVRLRELAEHSLDSHKCLSTHAILEGLAARLDWFHDRAMRGAGLLGEAPATIQ